MFSKDEIEDINRRLADDTRQANREFSDKLQSIRESSRDELKALRLWQDGLIVMNSQQEVINELQRLTNSTVGHWHCHVYRSDGNKKTIQLEHVARIAPLPVVVLCESMHYMHGAYAIPEDPMSIMDMSNAKIDGNAFTLEGIPRNLYVLIYYIADTQQTEKIEIDYYQIG